MFVEGWSATETDVCYSLNIKSNWPLASEFRVICGGELLCGSSDHGIGCLRGDVEKMVCVMWDLRMLASN